jgi:hypothetical protein
VSIIPDFRIIVFPTRVGLKRSGQRPGYWTLRVPHTRGAEAEDVAHMEGMAQWSPRGWGWSGSGLLVVYSV